MNFLTPIMKFLRLYGCCCLDLKSGTLCIGIIFLVGQIISVVQSVVRNRNLSCVGVEDVLACQQSSRMEMIFTLVGNFVFFVVTVVMLCGSAKEKYKLMIPYLAIRGTGIIILLVALWYIGITYMFSSVGWGITILLFGTVFICLEVYFWLVINSRRLEIQYGDD